MDYRELLEARPDLYRMCLAGRSCYFSRRVLITSHDDQDITIHLGQHDIPVPAPLGRLLLTLAAEGKPHTGTGTPQDRKWLFPGQLPGRPITPERLAQRLRAIGVPVMAGRRTALIDLAAQMPAAVLADSLGFRPRDTAKS